MCSQSEMPEDEEGPLWLERRHVRVCASDNVVSTATGRHMCVAKGGGRATLVCMGNIFGQSSEFGFLFHCI